MHDPHKHHRRSIRLQGYDYAQNGACYVTICVHNRACVFGAIVDDAMQLNAAGNMVHDTWLRLPARFPSVELDAFAVMPNHMHVVIALLSPAATGDANASMLCLGDVVGAQKSITTEEYIRVVKTTGWPAFETRLWQRNYYEHVVRSDAALQRIRRYIDDNPAQWGLDQLNPDLANRARS